MKLKIYRLYEIIPGALVWVTLLGAVILSWLQPLWAIYLIILFDFYWLMRVIYFVFYISTSWRRYQRANRTNWFFEMQKIKGWNHIYHLIFLPVYKESESVTRVAFNSLLSVQYPKDKFIVVLAGEERDGEKFLNLAKKMEQEFASRFGHFFVTVHPKSLGQEIPGKGSNLNFSGRKTKEFIDALRIPYDKIMVSAFDIDTVAHPQYFAYLTHRFLTSSNPLRASYQPVALYSNNIWEAAAPVRVAAFGTTFWLMTELSRPERLFTFSSHSMPWQALVDVGFWQKDIVSEDSRIFLQCFVRYNGDYRVEPLYLPVSMDAVSGRTYWRSLVNLYKQQRRWAWGVENFPYMMKEFSKTSLIPWQKKLKYLWNQTEGMYSWATAPLLILFLGRLPFWFASGEVSRQLIVQNAPILLEWLMRLSMVGLFLSIILSLLLLPPRPKAVSGYKRWTMLWQWILLPVSLIIFGSLPALDAQTRLLLGRYLGYNVTEKLRKTA